MTLPPAAPVAHGALALDGVGVRFGWRTGLASVSVTVARSRRLAIVGPSGAGKTTLLRAVAGLAPVVNGRILVDGRDVTALSPEKRDIVYLHQTPVLFEHLSVGENVAFPLRVRRVRDDDVRVRVAAALTAMQLPGLESRAPRTLSGGQRHRVALARAIVARPAVLLLDEPLSALDPALRADVRAAIIAAQSESAPAIVFVTHDFDDAGALADEVAVLLDGTIAQCAAPGALFAAPATLGVARLLGVYQTMTGHVRGAGGVECALGTLPIGTQLREGALVTLAFRASALRVVPLTTEGCGVLARVIGMRHRAQGTSVMVELQNSGHTAPLEATVEPGAVDLPGSSIRLSLDPHAVRVFPA